MEIDILEAQMKRIMMKLFVLFMLLLCAGPASAAIINFAAPVNYSVGSNPLGVAVGDFNGDGKLDLAVANTGSNTVSILMGNGDGTFSAAVNYGVGTSPCAVAVGDFSGDGKLDLAVANAGSNTVSILMGNGDGTFSAAVNYAVPYSAHSVAVGDFNGDGKLDLAVANGNGVEPGYVSILKGNGGGTFSAAVNYAVKDYPYAIATGDFNGDGKLDLAAVDAGSSYVSILMGKGDGTFFAAVHYPVGSNPYAITVGDFNSDGIPDLAVANNGDNTVIILTGDGQGAFSYNSSYINNNLTGSPTSIASADFDGDGVLDLAVPVVSSVNLFRNDPTPSSFWASDVIENAVFGARKVAVGDFNGDGRPDLAVTNDNGYVTILLNSSRYITVTTLSAAPNPSVQGQAVTLTAKVTSKGGIPMRAGNVSIYIDQVLSCNLALDATGQAQCTISTLALGSHSILADFSDGVNYESYSDPLTQIVNPPAPAVSGISPASGWTGGGTSVTITGTNLAGATAVHFGTNTAAIISNTGTQLVVTSPTGSVGTVDVTVTTSSGTSAVSVPDQFTYMYIPVPTVTGVSPAVGTTAGGTVVTISGTNFTGATAVNFGSSSATSFTINSATRITATSPAGSAGTVAITVTGSGIPSIVNDLDRFTYMALTAAFNPAVIAFGNTPVGGSGDTHSASFTNTSTGLVTIGTVALEGANPLDFKLGGTCANGSTIAAGGSCTITVVFMPGAVGEKSASISASSNAAGSPHTVALSAKGTISANTIVFDPSAPATLYAGLDGAGVYRSTDSGANWNPAASQPANLRIKALVMDRNDSTKLYAASYGGGVSTSSDSGDHWSACATTGLTDLNLLSLAIDASGKLYAGSESGVFVSTDGCVTWSALSNGLP